LKPASSGPAGVATVSVRLPDSAVGDVVMTSETDVVETEVIVAVTPVPLNVTPVAASRFWPDMVPVTVVPGAVEAGDMEVIAAAATVMPGNGGVAPAGVATVTVRCPSAAPAATVNIAETVPD